ncbi:MAG TPA: 30S ribosomal protein S8 [Candidatus Nanoarchaeia archaeon]|nr:30S ribosomal protein S8 [Candidatus Nanoarchaeia archaeon]
MVLNDPVSNALSKIMNAEKATKRDCVVKPFSKTLKEVLRIMNERMYIGGITEHQDGKGNFLKVDLIGRINGCNAIKPRHSVKKGQFEKFEKRYLPAREFGMLVVSTSQGIMAHEDAKKKRIGGRLIAYVY